MKYNVGDTVPDFEMESTDGTVFRLSEAVKKNPVLVNFYVGDFGINCTNYMTKFNERIGEIASLGVTFVGVNDNPMDGHKVFKQRLGLKWELLFDKGQAVAKEWECIVGPGHLATGMTNREFYLIDKDMKVLFKWRSEVPKQLPEFDAILDGVTHAL
ncbi:MAG: redoxin domain-containing protein [Candidatus Methanomethylophilaceae archaeon]|jgi:peroxiredoxin Q/BCP|nr:redoxin domain-containing protein [Candidatus Methanomethylophilaceae archaeon]